MGASSPASTPRKRVLMITSVASNIKSSIESSRVRRPLSGFPPAPELGRVPLPAATNFSAAGRWDGDAFRRYKVLPAALLVNYKALRFAFAPAPERGAVRLYVEPRPPALEVVNLLKLAEGACPEGSAFRELLKATFEAARQRAIFAGRYPASCGEKDLNVALLEPNDHIAGMLRQFWLEMGGAWSGSARDGQLPPGARLLHALESAPLAEIVRDTNKFSNNIMARHLYLTLGAESAGPPASTEKAAAAIKAWIARKGISAPELVMENGSGLSRHSRATATRDEPGAARGGPRSGTGTAGRRWRTRAA